MSSDRMTHIVKTFNPQRASQYVESLSRDQRLTTLIRYNHELGWSLSDGLQPDEVQLLASKCGDPYLQDLYEMALKNLKNDDESTLIASTGDNSNNNTMSRSESTLKKSYVLYAEKNDDEYDILAAYAIQTKEYDWTKIVTVGLGAFFGSAGIGAGVGSICGPASAVVGSIFGGAIASATSIPAVVRKACEDYRKEMPEAVYGYVFKELQEKCVLSIEDNKFTLHHN